MQRLFYAEVYAKNDEHAACEKEVNYLSQFYFLNYVFVAFQNLHSHAVRILETSVTHDTRVTK